MRAERSLKEKVMGCGCVFAPAGVLAGAAAVGLMLGDPMTEAAREHARHRGSFVLLALAFAVGSYLLGTSWLVGYPRAHPAAALILGGWIVSAISFPWVVGTAGAGTSPFRFLPLLGGLALTGWGLWSGRIQSSVDFLDAAPAGPRSSTVLDKRAEKSENVDIEE